MVRKYECKNAIKKIRGTAEAYRRSADAERTEMHASGLEQAADILEAGDY